jgi:CheY-like chemotaxis protein/HPt (histidine-containing phosphotransfer) domain-containing protein
MPYGKVLVVDDVDTNLYVAEGLLSPYQLIVETAGSGFATIDMVKEGKVYDVIFMDHMMPKMDGVETTRRLREFGYTGTIIALTANAIRGNEELFMKNGFDGFVPKPIDIRELNAVLNQFVRDKYPDEAKKYKDETIAVSATTKVNPKIYEIFCRDAEKAIHALRETMENGDMKLFTTTAHAMKSALANIGESDKSNIAFKLEKAGSRNDNVFISEHTENFVQTLERLVKMLAPVDTETAKNDKNLLEDTSYLAEQLLIIKAACEDYDDTAAYDAMDQLKKTQWKSETLHAIERIYDMLFLHSDFDGAAEGAEEMLSKLPTK